MATRDRRPIKDLEKDIQAFAKDKPEFAIVLCEYLLRESRLYTPYTGEDTNKQFQQTGRASIALSLLRLIDPDHYAYKENQNVRRTNNT